MNRYCFLSAYLRRTMMPQIFSIWLRSGHAGQSSIWIRSASTNYAFSYLLSCSSLTLIRRKHRKKASSLAIRPFITSIFDYGNNNSILLISPKQAHIISRTTAEIARNKHAAEQKLEIEVDYLVISSEFLCNKRLDSPSVLCPPMTSFRNRIVQ